MASHSEHVRYTVRSSDVLADMRINVCKEGSDVVVWYKERFLAEDEIIEHVVENATSTIHWTIHRPNRGWYIRIRSPTFPPGVYISLAALPKSSPYHSDAALTFACRTSTPSLIPPSLPHLVSAQSSRRSTDSDATLTDGQQRDSVTVHSYPPTPPTTGLPPRIAISTADIEAKLHKLSDSTSSSSSSKSPQVTPNTSPNPGGTLSPTAALLRPQSQLISSSQITHFLVSPHAQPPPTVTVVPKSLFTRLTDALKSHAPARSSFSFNMCAVPPPHRCTPTSPVIGATSPNLPAPNPHLHPLVTFHDTTPVWTVRTTTGLLDVDEVAIRALGVDLSFYVAVALTYLEFLEEREGYLAAAAD
ncbi:hypothetical protein BXZ70DRAFT_703395 [Cristinia sonorae]|uniref:Uncharacterized protein n=1 Tax=Cristinia sonorae TaxID=1940300 RepID=A0A8K0XJV4_9AGAR|nr:hypothetical protein BXZ70DRAFT_703395 [Cristinia sonorae]